MHRTGESRIQAAKDTQPATVFRIRAVVRADPALLLADILSDSEVADTKIQRLDMIQEVDMGQDQEPDTVTHIDCLVVAECRQVDMWRCPSFSPCFPFSFECTVYTLLTVTNFKYIVTVVKSVNK